MDHTYITAQLKANTEVFRSLLSNPDKELIQWKQSPEKWCLLEIICHIRDEEVEDFRARTFSVLEDPSKEFTPIDPVGWVNQRKYMEQSFEEIKTDFLNQREISVQMLEELSNPNWDNTYQHPSLGPMSAWLYLTNWLAHDYLHIKQITRLKYDYLKSKSGENLAYAGNWT